MRQRANHEGFSLIEVLITLFVVAVGLLGIAGLQTFAKKSNFDSVQRTTAAALAQDIIERMRANPSAASSYITGSQTGVGENAAMGTDCGASGAICSPAQMVVYDKYKWSQALFGSSEVASDGTNAGGLSLPTGCVTSSGACQFAVTIAWRGVSTLDGADTRTGTAYLCGINNPDYNGADGKPLRRVVVVQTFIDPGTGTACAAATSSP